MVLGTGSTAVKEKKIILVLKELKLQWIPTQDLGVYNTEQYLSTFFITRPPPHTHKEPFSYF